MASKQLLKRKKKTDRFAKLAEDCRAILEAEKQDIEKSVIIRRHGLGLRILKDIDLFPYGKIVKKMEQLASMVGLSWQNLYYCKKFAELYPNLETFLTVRKAESKEISWHIIVHEYLYKRAEQEVKEAIEKEKEKPPEEPKLCDLEKALNQLLMAINPLKDEMLDCTTCELRGWCVVAMAKLDAIGTPRQD